MGGQYQRPRTLKDVLHLPVEYTAESKSWNDRKILGTDFFTFSFPRWKNISARLAYLKPSNLYCYLVTVTHTLLNLTCRQMNFSSLAYSKCGALCITYGPRNHAKYEVLLSTRFPLEAYELRRDSKRLSSHLHYQSCSFQRCLPMEFSAFPVYSLLTYVS
jgi:hypothetical protein